MKQILNLMHYEILHVFRDPILLLIVFIAPLFYCGLFGAVYYSAILKHIPVAIVDLDGSQISRELIKDFSNHQSFDRVAGIDNYGKLEAAMKNGTIRAGVLIPEDFGQKLTQNRPVEILTVYDASNLLMGFNIRKFFREVSNDFNSRHTASYLAGLGYTPRQIENIMNSVECMSTPWYNPNYSYTNYLFMGLMMMVVHQLGLFGVSLAVTREKERNSWIHFLASGLPAWKIALGKGLPYLMVSLFSYALIIWMSVYFVGVKISGSVWLLILMGVLYVVTVTFAGFLVSLWSANSLQATRYLMLLSLPLFMISGYTWPALYMPGFLNGLARLFPSTWAAGGIRLLSLKDAGLAAMLPTLLYFTLAALLTLVLALNFAKNRKPLLEANSGVNCGYSYPRKINKIKRLRQQIQAR